MVFDVCSLLQIRVTYLQVKDKASKIDTSKQNHFKVFAKQVLKLLKKSSKMSKKSNPLLFCDISQALLKTEKNKTNRTYLNTILIFNIGYFYPGNGSGGYRTVL